MTQYAAVIVAAGLGKRTGLNIPKQFADLGGLTVLDWSIRAFLNFGHFSSIVVVISPEYRNIATTITSQYPNIALIEGGYERADSVRNALDFLSTNAPEFVFIHDAARPGLSNKVLDSLMLALETHDGAAPFLPVVDATKSFSSSGHLMTIDRATLHRIQTPQAFRFEHILTANKGVNSDFVDDLEAVQSLGLKIKLVEGETQLMKITQAEDLEIVEYLLKRANDTLMKFPRIGSGFDVHAFETGDHVTLCGINIPHSHKLKGHSDADVAWHALTDAMYGALACGDIGTHFPPTDPQWKGVDSAVFLTHAAELVREKGFQIANADITIICESPKIKPNAEAMRARTADILNIPIDRVSVKATTTELLGFTGRKEGIATQASILLSPMN